MKDIQVNCKSADSLPIDRLLEFQGDLKKLTKANREKLQKSIERHGFIAPIFVWDNAGDYMILDGHQRLATLLYMRQKGYNLPMIPVDYIKADSEADARDKLLHITSQYGEFNVDELEEWLADIDGDIYESVRFAKDELKIINKDDTVDDDGVPDQPPAVTTLGDIWELGPHRLLCGDSTDPDIVGLLMNGKKADMVFTDPPYNINYQGVSDKREKIKNDKMPDDEFVDFLSKGLMGCETMYVCCSWQYSHLFKRAMEKLSRSPKAMIVWDKVNPAQHLDKYFKQHEIIFYYGDFGGHKTLRGDVWTLKRERNTIHPTMKPVELIDMAIIDNKGKSIVYDGFLGSGSTVISAEKNHMTCYGMEIDPHYCDIIVARYCKWMTDNKRKVEIKLNGEVYEWAQEGQ